MTEPLRHYGIEHARDLANDLVEAVTRYNRHLYAAARQLEQMQADRWGNDRAGRVVLRLVACGRTCIGCPHPDWKVQMLRRNSQVSSPAYGRLFIAERRVQRPGQMRSVTQAPGAPEVISEIRRVIAARSRLIDRCWRLRQSLAKCFPEDIS